MGPDPALSYVGPRFLDQLQALFPFFEKACLYFVYMANVFSHLHRHIIRLL